MPLTSSVSKTPEEIRTVELGSTRYSESRYRASASTRGENFSYRDVFHAADGALYEAKQAGRNRICIATAIASTFDTARQHVGRNRPKMRTSYRASRSYSGRSAS